MIFVPCSRAERLCERRVEENPANAGDMGKHSVEHPRAVLIRVETLGDMISQITPCLRNSKGEGMSDGAAGEIRPMRANVADDVPRRRETDALHPRVRGLVTNFVDRSGDRFGAFGVELHRPGISQDERHRNALRGL